MLKFVRTFFAWLEASNEHVLDKSWAAIFFSLSFELQFKPNCVAKRSLLWAVRKNVQGISWSTTTTNSSHLFRVCFVRYFYSKGHTRKSREIGFNNMQLVFWKSPSELGNGHAIFSFFFYTLARKFSFFFLGEFFFFKRRNTKVWYKPQNGNGIKMASMALWKNTETRLVRFIFAFLDSPRHSVALVFIKIFLKSKMVQRKEPRRNRWRSSWPFLYTAIGCCCCIYYVLDA